VFASKREAREEADRLRIIEGLSLSPGQSSIEY
jgi:hypothetical protein